MESIVKKIIKLEPFHKIESQESNLNNFLNHVYLRKINLLTIKNIYQILTKNKKYQSCI
jgi:hypothetical protein